VKEARDLVEQMTDPVAHGLVDDADAFNALVDGDVKRARQRLEDALRASDDLMVQSAALMLLGWVHELCGEDIEAESWQQKVLSLLESHGESVYRTYALWSIGIAKWHRGQRESAAAIIKQALRLAHKLNDPRTGAGCLEALAWIASDDDPRHAIVLMGAAEAVGQSIGSSTVVFPNLDVHHAHCERSAREVFDDHTFEAVRQEGRTLGFDEAVAYALDHEAFSPS
jgi:tetratricopeptide (TPR) repeat protein